MKRNRMRRLNYKATAIINRMPPCYEVGEKLECFKLAGFSSYEMLTIAAATESDQLCNHGVSFQDSSTATYP